LEILKSYKRLAILSFLFVIMIMAAGATSQFMSPVNAKPPPPAIYYGKNFIVYMTLNGLNSTTGQVFAFVNVHGLLRSILFNATDATLYNKTSGQGRVYFSFDNVPVRAGESYSGCAVILNAAKMICVTGFKGGFDIGPQYLDISLR
jgi:hypothetical protein